MVHTYQIGIFLLGMGVGAFFTAVVQAAHFRALKSLLRSKDKTSPVSQPETQGSEFPLSVEELSARQSISLLRQ